jgi:hypothetical protein
LFGGGGGGGGDEEFPLTGRKMTAAAEEEEEKAIQGLGSLSLRVDTLGFLLCPVRSRG